MTQTLFRWLSLLVLLLVLSGTSLAIAAEEQIYTIKKGDTLWDLSKKFIDDPYYWPNVWAKNPEITNPHLIFPGQKVRILDGRLEIIPAYPEADKQAAATIDSNQLEAPSLKEELITIKSSGGGDGFILTDEEPLGILVDSVDNRILLTKHDMVFLKMKDLSTVTVGDTYGLFQRENEVKDPHTNKSIGTMMKNLGFLQITEVSGETVNAKIGEVFREIARGAELFEYIPQRKEMTLQRGTTDQEGDIIAARDEKNALSTGDIIFINLGSDDGLVSGNLFYISRPRKASDEVIKQAGSIQLPDAVLGAAITIETKANTASAIIIKSVDAAFIGDKVSVVTN
ncbi:MAG: LysM peptidoglycan-binding domain-containing protein [Desulfuromusa sp.]|nr:LysM peptidoglycan-binding domain-containing protein [Desulfuromusa sp.]